MNRLKTALIVALGLLILCLFSSAQDRTDPDAEQGFALGLGRSGWEHEESAPAEGGGVRHAYRDARDENRSLTLHLWNVDKELDLSALLDSEIRQMGARGKVVSVEKKKDAVAGLEGATVGYSLVRDDDGVMVATEATYFRSGRILGRLAVTLPADQRDVLAGKARAARKALRAGGPLTATPPEPEPPPPQPLNIDEPIPDRVVTVIHGSGRSSAYSFLEALPGASRANRGVPVLLFIGERLSDAARSFLEKYRPGEIRVLGPPHPEVPAAHAAMEEWPPGGTVVVSERRLGPAVQAACLAVRLEVPLLIAGPDLPGGLNAARPSDVLVLGTVAVPEKYPSRRLTGPPDVAEAAGGAGYIALCNVHENLNAAAAILAPGLAALRGGIVLPVDMKTGSRSVPLELTEEQPPGLPDSATGKYLVGHIACADGRVLAGAPATADVCVGSGFAPRYGRLRIDLDGDGSLEADEEPRIGSMVEIDGRTCNLTYHYSHPFVPYFRSEILLGEADPAGIRNEVIDLFRQVEGIEHLALVGTPASVPFFYLECEGYFETYDIKQELASDAPYANLDDDSYLELPVGRIPVDDLETGSAIMATIAAYSELSRDAVMKAPHKAAVIQPGFAAMEGSLPWVLPNAEALIRGIEGDLAAAGIEIDSHYRDQVKIDEVIDSMRDASWIAYFNHSGPNSWGIHPGSSIVTGKPRSSRDRSVPELEGSPVVFGGGCSSAALDVGIAARSTFAGRFLELGAVAYLGNTRVASAHSEYLVKTFFARLASGDATIGQAYRDGRNFLAHLLEQGHLVSHLDLVIDDGFRDFLWGQYHIMNIFGDPALMPSLPRAAGSGPVEVAVEKTSRPDRLRIVVINRGKGRCDPLQIMAASGQGAPREIFARTGPGMTASQVPGNYVRDGLSPIRSVPEVQPGAWVDVELPAGARNVKVSLASGPEWSDRGFTTFPGASGEPRLQMFIPLVRATPEHGDGKVARRVEFDVRFDIGSRTESAGRFVQFEPRIHVEPPWSMQRSGQPRMSSKAREVVRKVEELYRRSPHRSALPAEWTMGNPQPRFFGNSRFHCRWDRESATVEAIDLPPVLAPRREQLEKALEEILELALGCPLPSLRGMSIDAGQRESAGSLLVLKPIDGGEGDERTEVLVAEGGRIERIVEHRFGLVRETRFDWRLEDGESRLESCTVFDPNHPGPKFVVRLDHGQAAGASLPEKITFRLIGRFPHDLHFEFDERPPVR